MRISHAVRRVASIAAAGASSTTEWYFGNPPPADVVVIDGTTADRLGRTVLGGLRVTALDTRFGSEQSRVYLSPRIVVRLLRHFSSGCGWFASYLAACLEQIQPKVVIDNIHHLSLPEVATRCPSIEFFVILLGSFENILDSEVMQGDERYQNTLAGMNLRDMNNFHIFCFGQKDIELFAEAGLGEPNTGIKHHAVGSLWADYFRGEVRENVDGAHYDLCFISQVTSQSVKGATPFERLLVQETDVVMGHLHRYVRENNLRCAIHLRSPVSDEAQERDYYQAKFAGGGACVDVLSNAERFSVYSTVAESKVTVSLFSTLGYEAIAWGKKAMFCPLRFAQVYRFLPARFEGDSAMWKWRVENPEYESFCGTLNQLTGMSADCYRAAMADDARYLVNFGSEERAHAVIRRKIDNVLSSSS